MAWHNPRLGLAAPPDCLSPVNSAAPCSSPQDIVVGLTHGYSLTEGHLGVLAVPHKCPHLTSPCWHVLGCPDHTAPDSSLLLQLLFLTPVVQGLRLLLERSLLDEAERPRQLPCAPPPPGPMQSQKAACLGRGPPRTVSSQQAAILHGESPVSGKRTQ